MTTTVQTKLDAVYHILDEIQTLSEQGIFYLEANDYHKFLHLINQRENALVNLSKIREELLDSTSVWLSDFERSDINKKIRLKFENFTKVDKKIFDIIKCKRQELTEKMSQANQGKNFLKNFKNQMNNQEIFSQKI